MRSGGPGSWSRAGLVSQYRKPFGPGNGSNGPRVHPDPTHPSLVFCRVFPGNRVRAGGSQAWQACLRCCQSEEGQGVPAVSRKQKCSSDGSGRRGGLTAPQPVGPSLSGCGRRSGPPPAGLRAEPLPAAAVGAMVRPALQSGSPWTWGLRCELSPGAQSPGTPSSAPRWLGYPPLCSDTDPRGQADPPKRRGLRLCQQKSRRTQSHHLCVQPSAPCPRPGRSRPGHQEAPRGTRGPHTYSGPPW